MARGIKVIWIDSDTEGVLGTKIYRDDILIATVPFGTLFYEDPTAEVGVQYKYVTQAYTAEGESTGETQGVNMDYHTIQQETTLTPIITNFRVNSATPTHVHFDAPLGMIEGLTIQGFTIAGKTITAVDTLLDYFTVSEPFDFWDNSTIKLEGGDGTIYDFTMEAITNLIDEPNSFSQRYVTVTGAGDHSGSSEANAWDLSEMEFAAGRQINIKAGNYGTDTILVDSIIAWYDGPMKLVGYKVTPGDITSNYYAYGSTLDSSEMPLFDGEGADNARGLGIWDCKYIIVKNLQFTDYGILGNSNNYGVSTERSDDIVMENINVVKTQRAIFSIGDNVRTKNCIAVNGREFNFFINGDFNASIGDKSYCDDGSSTEAALDYYFSMQGSNNININTLSHRVGALPHGGHGVAVTGQTAYVIPTEYNLIDNHTAINIIASQEVRGPTAAYNVFKNANAYGDGLGAEGTGGIGIRGGAHNNIFENCKFDLASDLFNSESCIHFQHDDLYVGGGYGSNNTIRNCLFSNAYTGIFIRDASTENPTGSGNKIQHCTFDNVATFIREDASVDAGDFTGTEITNCSISNSPNYEWDTLKSVITLDYNNFYNSFANQGTNATNYDPDFVNAVDYIPQTEMYVPKITGINYDISNNERPDPATIGAVELSAEIPPVIDINYYVSSSTGSDSNDGLTEETAWKTISGLVSKSSVFVPGDVIAFKCGDIWEGERYWVWDHPSGVEGNPITFTSYGTGEKPVITLHEVQSPTWTPAGSNIWTTSGDRMRIWKNGSEQLMAKDLTELGQYETSWWNDTAGTLHIYSTTDPSLDTWEWSSSNYTILITTADYIKFDGLNIGGGSSAAIRGSNYMEVTNCIVGWNSAHGILSTDATSLNVHNNVIDSNFNVDMSQLPKTGTTGADYRGCSDGVYIQEGPDHIIDNNVFKNWGHTSVGLTGNNESNKITNVKVTRNDMSLENAGVLYGRGLGYSGYVENCEIAYNYIHNTYTRNQPNGSYNHFHDNIIDGLKSSPIMSYDVGQGMMLQNYNSAGPNVIGNIYENNIFIDTDEPGIMVYSANYESGEVKDNIMRNNIVVNCGSSDNNVGLQHHEDQAGQGIYNNLIQNNLVYSSASTLTCRAQYNGTIYTVENFNTNVSEASNNIGGDPLLNPDYTVDDASPCINSGISALSTVDYFGNARPYSTTSPDIGVYEKQSL